MVSLYYSRVQVLAEEIVHIINNSKSKQAFKIRTTARDKYVCPSSSSSGIRNKFFLNDRCVILPAHDQQRNFWASFGFPNLSARQVCLTQVLLPCPPKKISAEECTVVHRLQRLFMYTPFAEHKFNSDDSASRHQLLSLITLSTSGIVSNRHVVLWIVDTHAP